MQKLNEWLSKLLQERGPDLFRSKGILSLKGTDHKCALCPGLPDTLRASSTAVCYALGCVASCWMQAYEQGSGLWGWFSCLEGRSADV